MDLEQQLGAALAPCKPTPALRAAVLARLAAAARPASAVRRGGRRNILFGTVLVVAAAATMLVMRLTEVRPIVATLPPGQAASTVSTAPIEPLAAAADIALADTGKSAAGEPRTLKASAPQTFTVQVLPLNLPAADPAVLTALNEFYSAAVSELRAVPGLVLLAAGDSASSPDYRLKFNAGSEDAANIAASKESGQSQFMLPGARMWRMQLSVESRAKIGARTRALVDGRPWASTSSPADVVDTDVVDLNVIPSNLLNRMEVVTGGASATYGSGAMSGVVNMALNRRVQGTRVDVEIDVEHGIDVEYGSASAGVATISDVEYANKLQEMAAQNPQQPDGYMVVYQRAVMGSLQQGPASLAANEIEQLRMTVFPVDAALSGKLRARVLDANQLYFQRFAALRLLAAQEGGMENPETLRGALALLAVGPDAQVRAAVWRLLRGKPQPAVLHPLLDLLGTTRDATLKLEILTTLAADYKGDPAALAALNSIATNDPDALVRNVALRSVSGEAAWREYVATTIGDARQTPAERFAPMAYLIQTEQIQDLRNLLNAQTLPALVAVLPPLLEDRASRQDAGRLLSTLHGVDSPLMVDLALASLDRNVEWSTRTVLVSLLGRHRDEPRAHQRLEQIVAGDDPQLRVLATAMLQMPAMPGR